MLKGFPFFLVVDVVVDDASVVVNIDVDNNDGNKDIIYIYPFFHTVLEA